MKNKKRMKGTAGRYFVDFQDSPCYTAHKYMFGRIWHIRKQRKYSNLGKAILESVVFLMLMLEENGVKLYKMSDHLIAVVYKGRIAKKIPVCWKAIKDESWSWGTYIDAFLDSLNFQDEFVFADFD